MRLIDHIKLLADEYCLATGKSLPRLATIVVNDGGFFKRITREGGDCTTGTVEKFLAFFRDGSNWPDNKIPLAAVDLLDRLINIASETDGLSPDNAAELIGARP